MVSNTRTQGQGLVTNYCNFPLPRSYFAGIMLPAYAELFSLFSASRLGACLPMSIYGDDDDDDDYHQSQCGYAQH